MDYQIVALEQKQMVGVSARTSNSDPEMFKIIGGLWQKLFADGLFFQLPNKVNMRSIGLYSDYADGVNGPYDITVGCEVSAGTQAPEGCVLKTIPAGNYAKVIIRGDVKEAVGQCWQELWQLPLDRAFTGDFEEYQEEKEGQPPEIHIYVALKG